ncbi:hypothetical protein BDR03DRAFT_873234, partial [Suillus americanus]
YPFTSREEWEVANFLLHSALSMAAINKFLQLSMVHIFIYLLSPFNHDITSQIK